MEGDNSSLEIRQQLPSRAIRVWGYRLFLIMVAVAIGLLGWAGFQFRESLNSGQLDPTMIALMTWVGYTSTPSATIVSTQLSDTVTPAPTRPATYGTMILSRRVGGRTHLWALIPGDLSPIQLTNGDWDDQHPSIHPDGTSVAFTSRRSGFWDLYILNLKSGELRQLTDTTAYEGHPTWSPDGLWLAYEVYIDGDFDIWVIPVNLDQPPIQLTDHPAADHSPVWDPEGRRIAFISHRAGLPDIFLANLDHPDERFQNLTNSPEIEEQEHAFSPDGSRLVYSISSVGLDLILVQDLDDLERAPWEIGQGRAITWAPDGHRIAAVMHTPIGTHLQTYPLNNEGIEQPGIPPLNQVLSLDWSERGLPGEAYMAGQANPTATLLYERATNMAGPDVGRYSLVELSGISAPNPSLSDTVDEVFLALEARTELEVGWGFLASLDNAFVGLNDPMPPGLAYNDWLYTGRAFAFSEAAVQAGWVEFIREDFGGQTYWRVFVLAGTQDGSKGEPLREIPWDFRTRHNGEAHTYDQGGSRREFIPPGFYIDFTQLAADYGFERLPALGNWRTFYPAARYNEFVLTDGLRWDEAMLELYPQSAIVTPTPYRTPTPTPTRTPRPTVTPWWWRWRTPSPTPTQTPQPSSTSTP